MSTSTSRKTPAAGPNRSMTTARMEEGIEGTGLGEVCRRILPMTLPEDDPLGIILLQSAEMYHAVVAFFTCHRGNPALAEMVREYDRVYGAEMAAKLDHASAVCKARTMEQRKEAGKDVYTHEMMPGQTMSKEEYVQLEGRIYNAVNLLQCALPLSLRRLK